MLKTPTPRKYLSADALFRTLYQSFQKVVDPRTGTPTIQLPDALMSKPYPEQGALFALKILLYWRSTSADSKTRRTCR